MPGCSGELNPRLPPKPLGWTPAPEITRVFSVQDQIEAPFCPGGNGTEARSVPLADVANPSAIVSAAKIVEGKLNGAGLNLLINNAGIFTPVSLETVDSEEMIRAYKTNAVGPLLMAQVTLPSVPCGLSRVPLWSP